MRALRLVLILGLSAAGAGAQVLEVRGGASTLYDGFGLSTGFWSDHYDGWIGAGFQTRWRYGGFLRLRAAHDSLELGNNVLSIRLPTDVFGNDLRILAQGVRLAANHGPLRVGVFTGATATAMSMPLFAAHRAERNFTGLRIDDSLPRGFHAGALAVVASQPTVLGSFDWRAPDHSFVGVSSGANRSSRYNAIAGAVERAAWEVRASVIAPDKEFRRAALPLPTQTTLEGINVELTVQPIAGAFASLSRHAYATDAEGYTATTRAHGVSGVLGYTGESAHIVGGRYRSRSDAGVNLSGYVAAGMMVGARFGADAYVMRSRFESAPAKILPALLLHERINERLTLDQAITGFGRGASLGVGGSYIGRFGDYALHYQIVNDPFDGQNPFKRTANLSVRLQLGEYNANIASSMAADGSVTYTALAERYLYVGSAAGTSMTPVRIRLDRFLIEGNVQDEEGIPLAGAAVAVGDEVLFTDSRGHFFTRVGRRRDYPIEVRLDQFVMMGTFVVVSAPRTAKAEVEGRTTPILIVLRRH